tara:strand:- start:382 stop:855 length:474 start_codon:yes stop_codon:yes gene_type:complete
MTLGQAIEKDIKDTILVVPNQTLTEIGREYKEHIWKVSERSQPDGSGRQVLSTKYAQRKVSNGRKRFRDFIWTGTARKSFYFEQDENTISFDYNDDEAYYYMDHHENKGDGHRLYPIEKDSDSSLQKPIINSVENKISNILNKPRTLKAKATVTRLG